MPGIRFNEQFLNEIENPALRLAGGVLAQAVESVRDPRDFEGRLDGAQWLTSDYAQVVFLDSIGINPGKFYELLGGG